MSYLEVVRVEPCELTTKFSQVREWQYVVTLQGICGDPLYTSCTNPMKLVMKIWSECSCLSGWAWCGETFSENGKWVFMLVVVGHEVGTK